MAHAAAIRSLIADLAESITGSSSSERWKYATFKRLCNSAHVARTSQFDVDARLEGLEEKFRILNNDDMADALRLRLNQLSASSSKWTPEVLLLFLELSDQPAGRRTLPEFESRDPGPLPTTLTWSDILADDPLDNANGLWDDIDYTATDSDDEVVYRKSAQSTSPNLTSSLGILTEEQSVNIQHLITLNLSVAVDDLLVTRCGEERVGRGQLQSKSSITEEQACRDVLHMLHGLPTSTFVQIENRGFLFSEKIHLNHISATQISHVLDEFSTLGNHLTNIRAWLDHHETTTLQRSLQAAVASRIRCFEQSLSIIEARVLDHGAANFTTLLQLLSLVRQKSRYVQQLGELLKILSIAAQTQGPFYLLQLIYEQTCANQCCGDIQGYVYMAKLFFEGFRTYLRSVEQWMEAGELRESDNILFIKKKQYIVPLDLLWAGQYAMIEDDVGIPFAPRFLHLATPKIMNTGKSVIFLKALGQYPARDFIAPSGADGLTFEAVNGGSLASLSAFSELFELELNQWIAKHYHSSSSLLCQHLKSRCLLQDTLNALELTYLYRDGARSDVFAYAVFARIDRGKAMWDTFILTELIQEAFYPLLGATSKRMSIRLHTDQQSQHTNRRSVKILGGLQVCYSVPWAVANIIHQESMITYQRTFILLLQAQRARDVLARLHLEEYSLPTDHCSHGELLLARSLRHRLLWFTNCTLTYLTSSVIAVSTTRMRDQLNKAEDMDRMIFVHSHYINCLEEQCLLSAKFHPILQAIISNFDLAVALADAHAVYASQLLEENDWHRQKRISVNHRTVGAHHRLASSPSSDGSLEEYRQEGEQHCETSTDTTYLYRLNELHATFTKLHSFIVAGLQGVHRAGADPTVEVLAELLAVNVGRSMDW